MEFISNHAHYDITEEVQTTLYLSWLEDGPSWQAVFQERCWASLLDHPFCESSYQRNVPVVVIQFIA
jgi:hypothetical protein